LAYTGFRVDDITAANEGLSSTQGRDEALP
jgi:hypothetical protein